MRIGRFTLVTLVVLAAAFAAAETNDVIRTASGLAEAAYDRAEAGRRFDLLGRIIAIGPPEEETSLALEDETGCMVLRTRCAPRTNLLAAVGARVRASGFVRLGTRSRQAYARCDAIDLQKPGRPPAPIRVTAKEFLSGACDCRLVRLSGIVRDIITDEVDPRFVYVVLNADGESISVPRPLGDPVLRVLAVGSAVEATGICLPSELGARRQLGRHLADSGDGIRILTDAKDDPFGVPEVSWSSRPRPQDIAALGRHRASGRIVASWHGAALMKTRDDRIVGLENSNADMPHYGDWVEAVGFPESNLYHINLCRVIWRRLPHPPAPDETPAETSAERLLTDANGHPRFDPFAHGHAVSLRGTILNLPSGEDGVGRFNLQCGAFVVPVDATDTPAALAGLSVGSVVAVSGTCVMECENWRPNAPFPTIRGILLVVRTPADIKVLKHASWWTTRRLMTAIGSLFVILIGSLVWSVLLKRLAERRGRELAHSAIAKAEADLKVLERTRLAVELHDSLSQYLTGISLAIRAAARTAVGAPADLRQNLSLATTSLDSCRQELRNCLWDLRNRTLDEESLDAAIRQTLAQHLGDATLTVRFNVPRERFTDNTAHAILHILRELATNAVRHGHATQVKIAGSIEGDRILFSVRDNGCGFDPAHCPGMDSGHFGLQGIRERVNQFEGEMTVASTPSAGTRVTVALHIPGTEGNVR